MRSAYILDLLEMFSVAAMFLAVLFLVLFLSRVISIILS